MRINIFIHFILHTNDEFAFQIQGERENEPKIFSTRAALVKSQNRVKTYYILFNDFIYFVFFCTF
jgi:hypothetical protein